jgi:hypothetical protein
MGFLWEREWESELDGNGNGNDSTGMEGMGIARTYMYSSR